MNNLKELYTASETSDWNKCLDAARRILPSVPVDIIMEVLLIYLKQFANSYDEHIEIPNPYSNNEISIDQAQKQIQQIHSKLKGNVSNPGVSNFRNALTKLDRLLEIDSELVPETELLIEVFAGSLMSLLIHDWGRKNTDLWNKWYRREAESYMYILAEHFWANIKTREEISNLWHSVAKNIEDRKA